MNNTNKIHIHPALSPRAYILKPYCFYRINNISKEETEEIDNVLSFQVICVNNFSEIKKKVLDALNISSPEKVTIDSVGEEDFDEGFTFGNSICVEVIAKEYSFIISFDCYTTFNAFQWGENAGWE